MIAPGDGTATLTGRFTLINDIAGAQFNAMTLVDIEIGGYFLDASQESDAGMAWNLIQKRYFSNSPKTMNTDEQL